MTRMFLLVVGVLAACQSGTRTETGSGSGSAFVATAESCAASAGCRGGGNCVVVNGHCGPADEAACRSSPSCAHLGLCVPGPPSDPKCRAGSAADCEHSEGCRRFQRCVFALGTCQPR